MVDTARSLDDMLALMPRDGSIRITAQTIRDLATSMIGVYGNIYEYNGSTVLSGVGTAGLDVVLGTKGPTNGTTLHPDLAYSASPQTQKIQVDMDGTYLVCGRVTFAPSAITNAFILSIAHDVSGVTKTVAVSRKLALENDHEESICVSKLMTDDQTVSPVSPVTAGESFWLRLATESGTANCTIKQGNLTVRRI